MQEFLETAASAATISALTLNAWHHAGWPVAMKIVSRLAPKPSEIVPMARDALPEVTIVMPAYNEAPHIAAKIRNLAELDYPADRLHVLLACDGCTDATAQMARDALAGTHLSATVLEHTRNRGKVTVMNGAIAMVRSEIVALTDVSAMLPPDALLRAAAHFADPALGAVGGTYRLENPGSQGEAGYWKYQVAVKRGEAAMGAPLGLHGAFYAIRRAAWQALPTDTINDDFILPLEIFGRGWRVAYDDAIIAREADATTPEAELNRRRRIAGGNAQQLVRLAWLLNPRFGGVALAFASGKALRVAAPFLIGTSLLGALALAPVSKVFAVLAALQVIGLLAAATGALMGRSAPRPLAIGHYILSGHLASATGVVRYCRGHYSKPWRRDVIA